MQVHNHISIDKKLASINNQEYQLVRPLATDFSLNPIDNFDGEAEALEPPSATNGRSASTELADALRGGQVEAEGEEPTTDSESPAEIGE